MKIYNVMKVPQGLGYDDVDYDAIYQSGYTAGYDAGYNDGMDLCSDFGITPSELVYPISGGAKEVQITAPTFWYVDDNSFKWEYVTTTSGVGWTGYSAESLNRIEVSEETGEGDKTITISVPDLDEVPLVFIGTLAAYTGDGHTALVRRRKGTLKAAARTEYGDFEKEIEVGQNLAKEYLEFGPSGGSFQIFLDKEGEGLDRYNIGLAYHFENDPSGHNNPWSAYTLNYSGSVTELPKTLTLTVPPYAEGLDPYWYGEDGEINVYYGFVFYKPEYEQIVEARYYITIQKPEEPKLYITHNFPAQEGQYREVPQTGATYTMTISGNTNWSANTVNFGPGVLCTLSQNSGVANESVIVTVTFPETSSTKQGLIELGASPMPEDGYTQDVNYFVFQFRQEGLPQ